MVQWFVMQDGRELGPLDTDEVRSLGKRGELKPESLIRKKSGTDFVPLAQIPELNMVSAADAALPCSEARYDVLSDQLRFSCPRCDQHYTADRSICGSIELTCENCGERYLLRAPAAAVPPPASAPAIPERPDTSSLIGDLICPHCWNTFSAGDVRYISVHPDLLGDPVAGPMEQRRFIPESYNAGGLPLDAKGMVCTDMACPHCHLALPGTILDLESKYISIVGAPSCGKSYYLTALVHQLRKSLPEHFNESFADADPRINRTVSDYENQMFMASDLSKVVTLLKTEQIGKDFSDQAVMNGLPVNLPKPFIFQCEPLDRSRSAVNLIFYDNAGEHFQPGSEKASNPATLHLAHSDAIFFLFDPLNDPGMRHLCDTDDPQLQDDSKLSNQTVLFSEMISRIRRHANMASDEKSPIPLIVTVGKYDAWENSFSRKIRKTSLFSFNRETLESEFDSDMLHSVSFSLRELMLEYAPGIVAQAEAFFETVLFVPVSTFGVPAACGESPSADGRSAVGVRPLLLSPVWVEIPFFAVLDHFRLLRRRKTESGIEQLDTKITADKIVFAHPLTGRKVQLPLHYAGHALDFDGRKAVIAKTAAETARKNPDPADFWK